MSTPAIAAQWTRWVAPARSLREVRGVEDVALDQLEVGMLRELEARERIAVQIVVGDDGVPVDELTRERGADEARAAADEDPLALEHPREA